jgi:hypothetical protein
MLSSVKQEVRMRFLNEKEKARYLAAQELGLMDKVLSGGWASLSGQESGRIGGWISARNRQMRSASQEDIPNKNTSTPSDRT